MYNKKKKKKSIKVNHIMLNDLKYEVFSLKTPQYFWKKKNQLLWI